MIDSAGDKYLLRIERVKKHFPIKKHLFSRKRLFAKALDDVSLSIREGETLGLVGESGCGKTTLGRVILRLDDATAGEIYFEGENMLKFSRTEMQSARGKIQVIFQDPYSSLNPRHTVGRIIEEPLTIHNVGTKGERREKIYELMEKVGLRPDAYSYYPHEFSGGQRQRIGIARALALNPKLIICDEPTSALDVSIQAQVINLLCDLQESYNLTYLLISHDLSVVKQISDRVAVMYLGRIVEHCKSQELYDNPLHPYSQSLLSASPIPDPILKRQRIILGGDVPSPIYPPLGCHFHTRCPRVMDICRSNVPKLREVAKNHWVRCFLCKE